MSDADIAITAGSGTKVDTRTVGAGTDEHRQVIVVGDPVTAANVASVDPNFGLEVQMAGQTGTTATGTITTTSSAITAAVTGYGNSTITVKGTYTGVTYGFWGSDDGGTTYFSIQVTREDSGQVLTSDTPGTNASVAYTVDLPGWTHIKVLATAWATGTANVRISMGGMPFMPVVSIGNKDSATTVVTNVSVGTSSTQLAVANPLRRGLALFNNGAISAFVILGAASATTTTAFSVKIPPSGYYEVPPGYTGRLSGIVTAGTASFQVTEMTA
jgi:hypothetical protein